MSLRRARHPIALLALLLFAATVISRLPFVTAYLWAWDGVLYARALEQGFHVAADLEQQRPHPPGHILYVAAAGIARLVVADSNTALVLVSIVAAGAGTLLVFALARRYSRPWVALAVAAAYAASPLVWHYSEIAFPYTLLGAAAAGLALVFRERDRPVASSLAFGLVAGARQDLLVLLAPLWIWSLLPHPWRDRRLALGALAGGVALWLIPAVALSDGPLAYAGALLSQAGYVGTDYSVLSGGGAALARNGALALTALMWGCAALGILLLVDVPAALAARLRRGAPRVSPDEAFFALWILPGLAFYALVHIGDWGHVFAILPGLYVLAAWRAERLVAAAPPRLAPLWPAAAALAVILAGTVFLASGGRFSAAALAEHDRQLAARIAYVRSQPVSETVILAREDYLLMRYYLPEYRIWRYDPSPSSRPSSRSARAARAVTVVVFTEGLRPRRQGDATEVPIGHGQKARLTRIEPRGTLVLAGEHYEPGSDPPR